MPDEVKLEPCPLCDEQIRFMAERFLAWPLPEDFLPDNGITVSRPNYAPNVHWQPTGTNLFSYAQAQTMVLAMIEGMPATRTPTPIEAPPCPELVERVARAIAAEFGRSSPSAADDLDMRWQSWVPEAEAAIEATRPTAATGQAQEDGGGSFELFRLNGLLARLDGDDHQIVQQAIIRLADLEHQHARDCELWNGLTISHPETSAATDDVVKELVRTREALAICQLHNREMLARKMKERRKARARSRFAKARTGVTLNG